MNPSAETASLLISEADRINSPTFIKDDPVQFPRQFSDVRDIEIAAILISHISWGKRSMILRDAERLLQMMDSRPYDYMMEQAFLDLPDGMNIHRTFFASHLKDFLAGMRNIYNSASTLQEYALKRGIESAEFPAWELAAAMRNEIIAASGGRECQRTIPSNLSASAIKRLNMALRWLVRRDGIVDIGIWDKFEPSKLFIPLDVHVGNTSRNLGLTERKANDRKTAVEITEALRKVCPEDPIKLDFALFGLGIESANV